MEGLASLRLNRYMPQSSIQMDFRKNVVDSQTSMGLMIYLCSRSEIWFNSIPHVEMRVAVEIRAQGRKKTFSRVRRKCDYELAPAGLG